MKNTQKKPQHSLFLAVQSDEYQEEAVEPLYHRRRKMVLVYCKREATVEAQYYGDSDCACE